MRGFTPKILTTGRTRGDLPSPYKYLTVSAPGTYYFDYVDMRSQDTDCFQFLVLNSSALTGSVSFELTSVDPNARNYDPNFPTCWVPFSVSGTPYSITLTTANTSITSTGKLTFTSVSQYTVGNEIVMVLKAGGTAGAETVSVSTDKITRITTITVTMQSGASTAAQIKTALDTTPAVAALISTAVTVGGTMVAASSQLTGGSSFIDINTSAPFFRVRVDVTSGTGKIIAYGVAKI